jgi:hypothetical protein
MARQWKLLTAVAVVAAGGAVSAPAASADVNGPTTRDCSLLVPAIGTTFPGEDPDFIQLSGVTVNPDGSLTAPGPAAPGNPPNLVSLEASESPDASDQAHQVSFSATVSAPGIPDQSFGPTTGIGSVTFSFPLTGAAPGSSYTIAWNATFDNGAHPCPGPVTPGTLMANPFTVNAS